MANLLSGECRQYDNRKYTENMACDLNVSRKKGLCILMAKDNRGTNR